LVFPDTRTDLRAPVASSQTSHSTEEHPLLVRLDQIGRTARRIRMLSAISAWLWVSVIALAAIALCDWLLRPSDGVSRWLLWACVAIVAGTAFRQWVWPAIRWRPTPVDVGQRLERLYPQLGERVSSAASLLTEHEPIAETSRQLRAHAIEVASRDTQGLHLSSVLRWSTARRWLLASLVTLSLIAIGSWLDPETAKMALRRVMLPWQQIAWPQRYQLQLGPLPEAIYRGDDLLADVRAINGALPRDATLLVRHGSSSTPDRYPLEDKDASAEVWIRNVRETVELRAIGGDDQAMPWRTVTVRPRPEITSHQLELTPPEYTGQEPRQVAGLSAEVPAGSTATLRLEISEPVSSVLLRTEPLQSAARSRSPQAGAASSTEETAEKVRMIPLNLAADGRSAELPNDPLLALDTSQVWSFQMVDRLGAESIAASQFTLTVRPDEAPSVLLSEPMSDLTVTTAATVESMWEAKDDYGVVESWLQLELPEGVTAQDPAQLRIGGEARGGTTTFPLDQFEGLKAGQVVALQAFARDGRDQIGQSPRRLLAVVSTEQAAESLAQQQAAVLDSIRQGLADVRTAQRQAAAARQALDSDEPSMEFAAQRVQSSSAAQASAQRRLSDSPTAAMEQLKQAIASAERNQLTDLPGVELLEPIRAGLESVTAGELTEAARRLAQSSSDLGQQQVANGRAELAEAESQQQRAAEQLEGLVDQLARWDAVRQVQRSLTELTADQQRLSQSVASAAPEDSTAGRSVDANRSSDAGQQRELARRTERTGSLARTLSDELREDDPQAAAALKAAADALTESQVADAMRQAAGQLEAGRTGQAQREQQQAASGLQRASDALVGRAGSSGREQQTRQMLEEMQQAAEALEQLQEDLASARQAAQDAEQSDEQRSAGEQLAQLADQLQQFSEQLQRARAESAAQQSAEAARQSASAGEQMQAASESEPGSEAASEAEQAADQAAQEAEQSLQRAEQQLRQEIRELRRRLQDEQIRRLASKIEGLVQRQFAAVEELDRLADTGDAAGRSSGRLASLEALANEERFLAEDTLRLARDLSELPAFTIALQGVGDELQLAAAGLERGEVAGGTRLSAEAAAVRLQLIAQAVEESQRDANAQRESESPQENLPPEDQRGPTGESIPPLATLRVIRGLQQFLLDETRKVDQAVQQAADQEASAQLQRRQMLAQQQRDLASQLEEAIAAAQEAMEEPESSGEQPPETLEESP